MATRRMGRDVERGLSKPDGCITADNPMRAVEPGELLRYHDLFRGGVEQGRRDGPADSRDHLRRIAVLHD